ncbi:MAG: alpha/beta hydrolase [Rhodoferax sp.]|nr:alpha/beta hydrolase [Rhodoferax sp.]
MNHLPIYALPGLLDDARLWRHQAAHFALRHAWHTADLSGHDSIAALAASTLENAPAPRFALVGLSMGGYVALEMLRMAPERVLALALLDTNARADSAQSTEMRNSMVARAQSDFTGVVDSLTPRLVHPSRLDDPEVAGCITDMAHSLGPEVFARQQRAIMGRIDSRPFLPRILCPTLVLCGRQDLLTPPDLHEEMAAGIPNARLVIVEDCGHMSALEQPQAVCRAMDECLARLSD